MSEFERCQLTPAPYQRLGCKNYVSYNVLLEDGIPYSVCENFIDTNTELVNAVSINRSMKKRSQRSSYEHFMNACEKLGIPGMKEFIDEERIEVLSKAVSRRVEELQEMELEQKKHFTLGSLQQ